MRRWMWVIVLLCAGNGSVAAEAAAADSLAPAWSVSAVVFDRSYAHLTVSGGAPEGTASAHMDSALEPLRMKRGLLVDLRGIRQGAHLPLKTLLARLTDQRFASTEDTLQPRGEWQFSGPLVILVKRGHDTSCPRSWALLRAFVAARPEAEIETSGDLARAKKRLKNLVAAFEKQRQQRFDDLFRDPNRTP